jgi:sugar lactone lactonase YvrE
MPSRRRLLAALAGSTALAATGSNLLATAGGAAASPTSRAHPLHTTYALPVGFRPEGLATGRGPYAYVTSLASGDVYRLNLDTGAGRVLTQGQGTYSAGIRTDPYGRLFVVGAGTLTVINAMTGTVLAQYSVAGEDAFLNDLLVTRGAVYVTDSSLPVLYKLPLGTRGALPAQSSLVPLPLGGSIVYRDGWNISGIASTPDQTALVLAQSNTGQLHRVDPTSGTGSAVSLGESTLMGADGLLLMDRTLYVAQAASDIVSTVRLNETGTHGRVIERRTDPRFDIPTSIGSYAGRLYLPNARVNVDSPQTAQFTVVAIPI